MKGIFKSRVGFTRKKPIEAYKFWKERGISSRTYALSMAIRYGCPHESLLHKLTA